MAFFDPADTPQGQGGIPQTDPNAPPTIYTQGSLTRPTTPMPTLGPTSPPIARLPPPTTAPPATPPVPTTGDEYGPGHPPPPGAIYGYLPGKGLGWGTEKERLPIPSTPGDPTHGGMFTPDGKFNPNYVPTGTTGATTTGGGNYNTRLPNETTAQWVVRWAKGNNRPDIAADPSYWVNAIDSKPKSDDMGYWVGRLNTPDTGGSGDSAGGFGAFTAPYTGTYVPPVTNFQAPVGTDDPGFKFAVEQGQDAIARSAAAKGNLLTGGTLKDLASYTTGAALQDYAGSYNRALNTAGFNNNTAFQAFGQNYDIFRNNQNDPFQKLYATTGLGLNAANNSNSALSNYTGNLSDLTNNFASQYVNATFGQGNANAAGTQISSAQRNQFYQGLSDYLKNYHF